ncbi:MAG: CBS domain-containing protein, partial [Gammaproteobacteria bacterium]|nr:CBS domain-containing protein [Gammaproteobacteria bacterium]
MNDKSTTRSPGWINEIIRFIKREPKNQQAIIDLLRNAEKRNLLDPDVLLMIEGALHVADLQVRDAMIAKTNMVTINANNNVEDIINLVVESSHSRFPVTTDDINDVIGILLAKELLAFLANRDEQDFDIKDMMRPAVFIPESKRLNVLLREFRINRNHMAIVVDEYGITGLITIEDVIEEIVGEIEDEFDVDEEEFIFHHGSDRYTVKAMTPIQDFNYKFQTHLSDDEYDTIGGLIIHAFGHLPKRGETMDFSGFNVKVLRADSRRIHLLRFEKLAN